MSNDGIVNIRGKDYQTVALRVSKWNEANPPPDGCYLTTELLSLTDERVIMVARIHAPDGTVVRTGHAEERWDSSKINATSALENCETSAVGRALAFAGLVGTELQIASADEVAGAIARQERSKAPRKAVGDTQLAKFRSAIDSLGCDYDLICRFAEDRGWGNPSSWADDMRRDFYRDLTRGGFPKLYTPPPPTNNGG